MIPKSFVFLPAPYVLGDAAFSAFCGEASDLDIASWLRQVRVTAQGIAP